VSFRLRPEAEADLEVIVSYIAQDDRSAARRWLEDMHHHCHTLGEMPGMGVARPDIRPDLRLFPRGNCLILYRKIEGGVEIVRVLHGARQWWEQLRTDTP
jgi:toxin ParE1/3/4